METWRTRRRGALALRRPEREFGAAGHGAGRPRAGGMNVPGDGEEWWMRSGRPSEAPPRARSLARRPRPARHPAWRHLSSSPPPSAVPDRKRPLRPGIPRTAHRVSEDAKGGARPVPNVAVALAQREAVLTRSLRWAGNAFLACPGWLGSRWPRAPRLLFRSSHGCRQRPEGAKSTSRPESNWKTPGPRTCEDSHGTPACDLPSTATQDPLTAGVRAAYITDTASQHAVTDS
jgi:hypothetical protein